MSGLQPHAQTLFKSDPDRAYAALFAPLPERDALFALYAFHHEIAKVREVVSETMLGAIRLQWWREAVDGIESGHVPRHELGEPLAEAVRRFGVAPAALHRMIDAREADFDDVPFETETELEYYVRETASLLIETGTKVLLHAKGQSGRWSNEIAACTGHAGVAWGLVGILRALPFHAMQGRCLIPRSLSDRHGFKLSDVKGGRHTSELSKAIADIAEMARGHLNKARAQAISMPRAAVPALVYVSLTDRYLKIIGRPGYDPFKTDTSIATYAKLWSMFWRTRRGGL